MFRRSKYGAKKTELDGFVFDSKREAARYSELKMLEQAGEIKNLTLQPKFPCFVNGKLVCTYIADFQYQDIEGRHVEDAKGFKTDVYKLKKKLVEALYDIKIEEV